MNQREKRGTRSLGKSSGPARSTQDTTGRRAAQGAGATRQVPALPSDDEFSVGAPYGRRQPGRGVTGAYIIAPERKQRGNTTAPAAAPKAQPRTQNGRRKIMLWAITAIVALPLAYLLMTNLVSWGQDRWDTWQHGYPRTFQTTAVVGHNDSSQNPSYFVGVNLGGQISIVEWPGGDASHARVYILPRMIGTNADRMVFSLSFSDVNHDGQLDMVVTIEGNGVGAQSTKAVFVNDQGVFRPAKPGEIPTSSSSLRRLAPASLLYFYFGKRKSPLRGWVGQFVVERPTKWRVWGP